MVLTKVDLDIQFITHVFVRVMCPTGLVLA